MAVIFMMLRALSNGSYSTQWLSFLCFGESTVFLPQECCNLTQWLSFSCSREIIRISLNIIILCVQGLCEAEVKESISEAFPSYIQLNSISNMLVILDNS